MLGLHPKWRATFMEAWPDEVADLGLPFEEIPLGPADRMAIGSRTPGFREIFEIDEMPTLSPDLRSAVEKALKVFPDGVHARLGGCSFKTPSRFQRAAVRDLRELTPHILQENPRVAGLLADSLQNDYGVSLFLRPWRDIPHWSEFRLFVRGKALVGASQYFHTIAFPEIAAQARSIVLALLEFTERFLAVSHLPDVIVDVFVEDTRSASGWQATLLDVNPMIRRADACLFDWQDVGSFDGGFRFRDAENRVLTTRPLSLAQAG